MQKSFLGLYQSLLHEILTQVPNLIPALLPERWRACCVLGSTPHPWTEPECFYAFKQLLAQDIVRAKFCYFIGGLDEFNGDHQILVKTFKELVNSSNIKICVTSRPHFVFQDAFGPCPKLILQEFTYGDIISYIKGKLSEHPRFKTISMEEPVRVSQLIRQVMEKAQGVFLWVNLVVQSLSEGLTNGDGVSELQCRIDNTPSEV